ncbi:response regulator transcription factor [Curtobacterium flaccumfaciens pv. flaccumfaciens]|uniref:response regulator n=1 Tax=Curtobacterium flaccumfaciens TaxID=2035 RepID=UPI001ADAC846|nr:response regulator transcription factor [Curtobacterium flaccumfaciens]MBO9048133.1 response regulator transcription factor [Curtobacterium flaccumfaciens pv. flaccumfaciens]MBO9058244.1 response regulator transcription factor [Curtobacterium flaccumfaciens pv. flaccumfaciens]QTR90203.1 response regulator transcription factor [Curtobacterium flaccumfaciens pv. flaccumfaciens]QVG65475.1 response regulator transcription factor [Curtobacterium flaccumfaciens pv. flaccumfaciens]
MAADDVNATTDLTIVLADDQELVRAGFRVILESEPGFRVVGEAADGAGAVEAVQQLRPDVVCLDVQMPGVDGLEAARRIAALPDPPAVLILTTFDSDDALFQALEAGASGFLLKNASPERLIDAVRTVAAGDALLAPDVTRRVISRATASAVVQPSATTPATTATTDTTATTGDDALAAAGLTERETEVLRLLARGLSNAEIAAELYVGDATVKTHVSNVLQKLALRDRIQAVVWAFEHGVAG